jgi:hypothetical protein
MRAGKVGLHRAARRRCDDIKESYTMAAISPPQFRQNARRRAAINLGARGHGCRSVKLPTLAASPAAAGPRIRGVAGILRKILSDRPRKYYSLFLANNR